VRTLLVGIGPAQAAALQAQAESALAATPGALMGATARKRKLARSLEALLTAHYGAAFPTISGWRGPAGERLI
jgi:hypothetical protein